MDPQRAQYLSKELNSLACKACTEGWLNKHGGSTDPIEDIQACASLGLITPELKVRLIKEVKELNS